METVSDKLEKKEKLSKLEQSLKYKSDDKLREVLQNSIKPLYNNFDLMNTWIPKNIITNIFEKCGTDDKVRIKGLIDGIRDFLFSKYSQQYYDNEVTDFIYKTDHLQQELDELKSQIE